MVSTWSKLRCPVKLEGIGSKSTYAPTEASSLVLASNRWPSPRLSANSMSAFQSG